MCFLVSVKLSNACLQCNNASYVLFAIRTYHGRYREHSLYRRNTCAHHSTLSSMSAAYVNRKASFPVNHFPRVTAHVRNLHEVQRYWFIIFISRDPLNFLGASSHFYKRVCPSLGLILNCTSFLDASTHQ